MAEENEGKKKDEDEEVLEGSTEEELKDKDGNPVKNKEAYKASQEAAQYRTKANDADSRAIQIQEEFEKYKREIEDKEKTDLEKAERDKKELEERLAAAEEERVKANQQLSIINHEDSKKFVSPAAVLKFVTDYKQEVDDKGNITNIGDILSSIAKDHPYLLTDSSGESDDKNNESNGASSSGTSSGTPMNGKKGSGDIDKAVLENKYPALRNR